MIRARQDTSTESFISRRVRLLVEVDQMGASGPERTLVYTQTRRDGGLVEDGWYAPSGVDYDTAGVPEGASVWAVDLPRDVARAVYDELAKVFDPEAEVPKASDRAYGDARSDIVRLFDLVDRLL